MDADLDALATAVYVKIDDLLAAEPYRAPWRPAVGIAPQITDAELLTLAVMQALLSQPSEAGWLRYAHAHLWRLFPYLPLQPGYNKRLRKLAGTMNWLLRQLAAGTSLGTDDVWVVDSTPVEGARSRAVACGSARAGWAAYGYCASHSRYLWGLRLHLIAPAHGLPVAVALTGAKADERQTLLALLADDPDLVAAHLGQTLIADKHYDGRDFQTSLQQAGLRLLRPTRKGERERAGQRFRKLLHQTIESIFATANGHLDLERHHGRTPVGVLTRILQRLLALTAVIWHNDHSGQPIKRSLLAYDH